MMESKSTIRHINASEPQKTRSSRQLVSASLKGTDSLMNHLTLVFALLVLIAGCGKDGPQVAPVHGRVTLDNQPLCNADIRFSPADSPRPSVGRTDREGRYDLMYKRGESGAVVGKHTVQVTVSHELVPNPPIIAAKFNSQSELHVEVKPGDNNFDFDVTTESKAAKK